MLFAITTMIHPVATFIKLVNKDVNTIIPHKIMIEFSVNDVKGLYMESNVNGYIIVSSTSFPTIPYQATLKFSISNDD